MPFSLYIHWPFCLKKCPYCDFNSYSMQYNETEWINALLLELDLQSTIFKNFEIQTIFFGGGTPSLISPQNIKIILNKIKEIWPYKNIEITIEINPSSIETHQLEQFLESGINRFSIGVQSLKDENLKFLGRLHNVKEAKEIVSQATKLCSNISCDFIYTLPNDTIQNWKKDLNEIISFLDQNKIKHCSLYQLTIEEKTRFFIDIQNNLWQPINEDMQSKLYRYTHKIMAKNQWNHYEISNFAKNSSTKSKHNLNYWEYKNYLGIGPGAHSRMILNKQKIRFNNILTPQKWKKSLKTSTIFPFDFFENYEILSSKEQVEEKLFMGLRLKNGIEIQDNDLKYINTEHFQYLLNKKILNYKNNKYHLTLNGQLKLNAVLKLLFI